MRTPEKFFNEKLMLIRKRWSGKKKGHYDAHSEKYVLKQSLKNRVAKYVVSNVMTRTIQERRARVRMITLDKRARRVNGGL